jgi:DNA-binding CsgD family transcriptional regulator
LPDAWRSGLAPFPDEIRGYASNRAFGQLIQRVVERNDLTRREALIVLCCIEGMSNAEIGKRLAIGEQTVKSHLRRVFDKFGVKRRTELLSCLLMKRGGRKNRLAEPRSSIQLGDPNLKIGSSD